MRVLINGIGRIGKAVFKIALKNKDIEIVAVNDINPNIENIAYIINYDSTYGGIKDKFKVSKNHIVNKKNKIRVFNKENLEDIDLEKYKIDFIIDASGTKPNIESLKKLPVKKIFLTHPNKEADINVIIGVNEDQIDKDQKVISTSSCNVTALLPIIDIVDKSFGIEFGEITTIHPLLNHQKVLDNSCIKSSSRDVKCNFEFGRSALENIIPSKTTTIDACSYVKEHINSDIISSSSFRVPTATVGAIDITLFVKDKCSKDKLVELFKTYEKKQIKKVILNNFEPLVSSDFKALPYSAAIDHRFLDVKMDKMLKLMIWYDNEWGYANKVVDIVKLYKDKC